MRRPYRCAKSSINSPGLRRDDACVARTGVRRAPFIHQACAGTTHASPVQVCEELHSFTRPAQGRRMRRPYRCAKSSINSPGLRRGDACVAHRCAKSSINSPGLRRDDACVARTGVRRAPLIHQACAGTTHASPVQVCEELHSFTRPAQGRRMRRPRHGAIASLACIILVHDEKFAPRGCLVLIFSARNPPRRGPNTPLTH